MTTPNDLTSFFTSARKTSRRKFMTGVAVSALAVTSLVSTSAVAKDTDWPQKPVTLVVPFAPGGPTDSTGRVLGDALSKIWDQPVIIENRAGAGGTVGAANVAKAKPDGYTLVLGVTGSHGIADALYSDLPYNAVEDFIPVSKAVIYPNAILANPDIPAKNLQELIELAKADPDYQVYATDGNGTASHLTMELLRAKADFPMEAVQYKGAAPVINDIIAGFVPVGITGFPSAEAQVKEGKLRLIALTTDKDYSENNYPTVAEQGFDDFDAAPWSGVFAPQGTPDAIVEKIAADVETAMNKEDVKEKMQGLGLTPMPVTLDAFQQDLDKERKAWAEAVEISGASAS